MPFRNLGANGVDEIKFSFMYKNFNLLGKNGGQLKVARLGFTQLLSHSNYNTSVGLNAITVFAHADQPNMTSLYREDRSVYGPTAQVLFHRVTPVIITWKINSCILYPGYPAETNLDCGSTIFLDNSTILMQLPANAFPTELVLGSLGDNNLSSNSSLEFRYDLVCLNKGVDTDCFSPSNLNRAR
jgi:hypothetical protein